MSDEATLNMSEAQQGTNFPFMTKQVVYIPDSNSGSYNSGQVIFDCASLSNSGKFIDWNSSVLTIPLVVNFQTSQNGIATQYQTGAEAFLLSLKNGTHHLINSLSVELTNNSICNLTNYSNLDINYRLLTNSSFEDMANFGSVLGFTKDTAESITYKGASDLMGIGECNNQITNTNFATTTVWGGDTMNSNTGRLARMTNTSFDTAQKALFTSANSCNVTMKNYTASTPAMALTQLFSNGVQTYYILATIPLRVLHPVFSKLPLMRGAYVKLLLNTNCQCSSAITGTATTGLYSKYVTTSPNGTFPIMMSPNTATSSINSAIAPTYTVSCGIAKSLSPSGTYQHSMGQCRLYCSVFEMSPLYQEKYLELVPTKRVVYNDIISAQVLDVKAGGAISQIITSGISRPRYLLIVPQISSAIHGTTTLNTDTTRQGANALGSPMNSPFSSAPGTTAPYSAISNFNVLISGSALYQSNLNYGFETYLQEVRASNALNGGVSLGLSSGILTQQDWESGYRFYYVDLSRKASQAQDDISRSIQLIGVNSSAYNCDYFVFVGYEREFTVSTATGSLVI